MYEIYHCVKVEVCKKVWMVFRHIFTHCAETYINVQSTKFWVMLIEDGNEIVPRMFFGPRYLGGHANTLRQQKAGPRLAVDLI